MTTEMRLEYDLISEREIPADCYYRIQTHRALDNFKITSTPISSAPNLIRSLAYVKKAAALANLELAELRPEIAKVVAQAWDGIIEGALFDQFVVDMIQSGVGTSTNMNANEVIAHRALSSRRLGIPAIMVRYRACSSEWR
jgi:aspartate ammonia-lyase